MTKLTRDDLRTMKVGEVKKAPLEQLQSLRSSYAQMAVERVRGGMKMKIGIDEDEKVTVVECVSPNTYQRV